MLALPLSLLLLPALASAAAVADGCPDPSLTSCSPGASSADACCVPNPGGLVLFSQRFEPDVGGDMGSWGIDALEVIE
jgi:ribonuclease T2